MEWINQDALSFKSQIRIISFFSPETGLLCLGLGEARTSLIVCQMDWAHQLAVEVRLGEARLDLAEANLGLPQVLSERAFCS